MRRAVLSVAAAVVGVVAFLLWQENRRYMGFWDDERPLAVEGIRGWASDPVSDARDPLPSEHLMRGNERRFGSAA